MLRYKANYKRNNSNNILCHRSHISHLQYNNTLFKTQQILHHRYTTTVSSTTSTRSKENNNGLKPFSEMPNLNDWTGWGCFIDMAKKAVQEKKGTSLIFRDWRERYHHTPAYRWKLPWTSENITLFEPEDYAAVFRETQSKGKVPFRALVEPWIQYRKDRGLPIGITQERDEEWKRLRTAANQIMLPKVVSSMILRMDECAKNYAQTLGSVRDEHGMVPNLRHVGFYFGLEVMVALLYGKKSKLVLPDLWAPHAHHPDLSNTEPGTRMMVEGIPQMFETSSRLMYNIPIWKVFPQWVPDMKRHYEAWDKIFDGGRQLKDTNKLELYEDGQEKNLMDYITAAGMIGEQDYDVMAVEFTGAGIDTTSVTLTWLLYNLAANPEKQEKLYEEIESCLGSRPQDKEMDKSVISKMKYLKNCLAESARINPTIAMHVRESIDGMAIAGYEVPAHKQIYMANYLSCHDPKYWGEDVEEFNPERWNHPKEEHHKFASLLFGFGARQCVGRRVAEAEVKIAASRVIQQFKLELDGGMNGKPTFNEGSLMVPREESGSYIRFVPRH
eukprot:gb/GECH01013747.1/.p1 GENE.gb/GECH01013747.1/~~gb/GECH01013747.1/.p1  ORF type:complete len:556 (+),score=141.18 gb/GECH01013747.1/:1-1668(+)